MGYIRIVLIPSQYKVQSIRQLVYWFLKKPHFATNLAIYFGWGGGETWCSLYWLESFWKKQYIFHFWGNFKLVCMKIVFDSIEPNLIFCQLLWNVKTNLLAMCLRIISRPLWNIFNFHTQYSRNHLNYTNILYWGDFFSIIWKLQTPPPPSKKKKAFGPSSSAILYKFAFCLLHLGVSLYLFFSYYFWFDVLHLYFLKADLALSRF